jgi:hypothetical protein
MPRLAERLRAVERAATAPPRRLDGLFIPLTRPVGERPVCVTALLWLFFVQAGQYRKDRPQLKGARKFWFLWLSRN